MKDFAPECLTHHDFGVFCLSSDGIFSTGIIFPICANVFWQSAFALAAGWHGVVIYPQMPLFVK